MNAHAKNKMATAAECDVVVVLRISQKSWDSEIDWTYFSPLLNQC